MCMGSFSVEEVTHCFTWLPVTATVRSAACAQGGAEGGGQDSRADGRLLQCPVWMGPRVPGVTQGMRGHWHAAKVAALWITLFAEPAPLPCHPVGLGKYQDVGVWGCVSCGGGAAVVRTRSPAPIWSLYSAVISKPLPSPVAQFKFFQADSPGQSVTSKIGKVSLREMISLFLSSGNAEAGNWILKETVLPLYWEWCGFIFPKPSWRNS